MNEQNSQIGALWKQEKVNVNGNKATWYSGNVKCPHCQEETKIIEFHNFDKKTDRHPDKNILVRQTKDQYGKTTYPKSKKSDSNKDKKQQAAKSDSVKEFDDTFDDEIPF